MDDTNPWEFYLSNTVVNSFYYASELVVACSIIELAKPKYGPAPAGVSPDVHALEELCKTVTTVSWLFTDLFGHLISAITRTEIPDYEFQTVKLPDGPKLSQLTLPFFVDENDVHRVPKQAA